MFCSEITHTHTDTITYTHLFTSILVFQVEYGNVNTIFILDLKLCV